MHTYMRAHTDNTHTHTDIRKHAYIHKNKQADKQTNIYIYINIMHAGIHTYINIHAYTHVSVYT